MTNKLPHLLLALASWGLLGCPAGDDDVVDSGAPPDTGSGPNCPDRLRFTALSDSVVHVGWTGITHNNTLPEGAEFLMDVVACDDECRNCRFEGPIPDPVIDKQRCLSDTSVSCTTSAECPPYQCIPTSSTTLGCANTFAPCGQDSDCEPSECGIFLGGNSASPIQPTCFAAMFRSVVQQPPVSGRIDLETGQVTFTQFGLWIVGSNVNRNPGFCPVCVGDTQRNDGEKDGRCMDNPHGDTMPQSLGQACDAHGNSGIPIRAGVYSLDCAVPMAPAFDLSTYDVGSAAAALWTLDPNLQPACDDGPCWCGVCEGTTRPCHASDECGGLDCVAAVQPPAVPPRSNRCADECVWSNDSLGGVCNTPVGVDDAGVPILGPTPCLPKGMSAQVIIRGSSEILDEATYRVATGGTGCAGPGQVGLTNQILGLPGPIVSLFRFRVDAE